MRKIKFRVWCEFEINGELHKYMESPASWFLLTQTGKLWSYGPTSAPRPIEKEYKKAIPLFYTGLKDKNDREIYEGDILTTDFYFSLREIARLSRCTASVYYSPGGFFIQHSEHFEGIPINKLKDREIIGNIYENQDIVA